KIEQPGRGDETRAWGPPFVAGESAYFLSINRNKESVTLDFKQPGGRKALDRLLERADVLVENFRPGTLDRLGLGYAAVATSHPRLVYCSISGFGQTGPRRHQAGYDAVMQAEGGLMSVTGAADGPAFRVGVAIADLVAGLLAAQGIVLALYARDRSGRGQHVDVGMLDGVVSLLTYHASMHLTTATIPSRVVHHRELRERLVPVLQQHPRAYWSEVLTGAGVPCGAVRNVPDALSDPQLAARNMIEAVEHAAAGTLKVLGVPIKLSETPGSVRTAPPTLGQHTTD